ncbi:alpha-tocopherol transfer protein-like [Hetaerina americana]|uniref:alpha-tocopherol transfer protein-like n=1 Tax=Hetaerina americana TaxID=62018 RepID=UPI003A7F4376
MEDIDNTPYLRMGQYELRFENGEDIGPALKEVARIELRETPEAVENGVQKLRKLLQDDTDLNIPLDDDAFLIQFLRPCKYYTESARALIRRYFAFKIKNPKLYVGLTPTTAKNILSQSILTVLPKRDQLGRRILVIESGAKWKPSQCSLDEIVQGCILMLEAAMREPKTQVAGALVLMDLDGLGLTHAYHFTPAFASRVVEWVQDCLPARLKAVHVVNQPYIFNMIFALFKPFMREKLRSRIFLHGANKESILAHIDADCLPVQYGGNMKLPNIEGQEWVNFFSLYENEYEEAGVYGFKPGVKVKV